MYPFLFFTNFFLLNEVKSGQSFEYIKQIEIKSGWTYNKNGADLELQRLNETKWKAVRNSSNLVILIGKSEIKGFVKAL